MMTGEEYKKSLQDGRSIYFKGERVPNMPDHPVLGLCVEDIAAEYDTYYGDGTGVSSVMAVPRDAQELREHVEHHTRMGLLSHITSTCVMTLMTAAGRLGDAPEVVERIHRYVDEVGPRDIRITECITDAKGNRGLAPAKQPDPDAYTRVVERTGDGVVIRGAKLHITGASLGHELMVIPTKAMKPGEEEYAIACMVPVNSPGVRIIDTLNNPPAGDEENFVFSRKNYFPEGFVMFDDVFVPNERIFMDGNTAKAGVFAHSLGLWERAGGLMNLSERAHVLVGLAHLIAEANGLLRISHIKDKLSELMLKATLIRATLDASIANCKVGDGGAVFPDELYTNAGKLYGAFHYNEMTREVWDICGGSLATAPILADLRNPDVGGQLRKYMQGAVDGEYRLRLLLAIRDLTAQTYGSWRAITALHSGGGLHAQRTVLRKHFDVQAARDKALALVELEDPQVGSPPHA
ncbi:4-hydroxyphenylacetate 3-hydroxylase N-terminal domain-containing protein [Nocardia sp. CA-120079]|uniref:4-hydroxyphenylacetate 3-hydroxylase N-terminal domain-containing protein n=1 Tax=Nocardia sp. CA-120079 TaxID=3239974 RepID=UPI003D96F707